MSVIVAVHSFVQEYSIPPQFHNSLTTSEKLSFPTPGSFYCAVQQWAGGTVPVRVAHMPILVILVGV